MTDDCIKKCLIKDIEKNSCACDAHRTAEDKVDDLKEAIVALGYKVEETPEGDIKISV